MADSQTPDGAEPPVDPKFKELAQFVMDQLWFAQARINVLEAVVQQLAISLAKRDENPGAWLANFISILKNSGGIADIHDPAKGQRMLQETRQAMDKLLQDLARNGKKIGSANDNDG